MEKNDLLKEVTEKYRCYINPGLQKLLSFAGLGVEVRAEGCTIYDSEGKEYLDCLGGYGVFSVGHRHPKVIEAAKKALDTMPLSGKAFFSKPVADLAEKLAEITPGNLSYSFFCNSGTEAVEGALKAARSFAGREKIISTLGGYHGKTMGSLSATGREKYKKPFEPLLPEFSFVPFGDSSALEKEIDEHTAAIILEPIQGEAGIHVPPPDYLKEVREICNRKGILLILDEVQTGFGRTGKMFAMEHSGIAPDIVTFAKAMGGGVVPCGAFMGTPEVWEKFFGENPLIHTSTFGGNPLAANCALATIEVIQSEGLCEKAATLGDTMKRSLDKVRESHPDLIAEVRGKGLMIGVEFKMDDVAEIVIAQMVKRGVVVAYTLNNPRVIRFEPPLVIMEKQVKRACEVFEEAVAETSSLLSTVLEE